MCVILQFYLLIKSNIDLSMNDVCIHISFVAVKDLRIEANAHGRCAIGICTQVDSCVP